MNSHIESLASALESLRTYYPPQAYLHGIDLASEHQNRRARRSPNQPASRTRAMWYNCNSWLRYYRQAIDQAANDGPHGRIV